MSLNPLMNSNIMSSQPNPYLLKNYAVYQPSQQSPTIQYEQSATLTGTQYPQVQNSSQHNYGSSPYIIKSPYQQQFESKRVEQSQGVSQQIASNYYNNNNNNDQQYISNRFSPRQTHQILSSNVQSQFNNKQSSSNFQPSLFPQTQLSPLQNDSQFRFIQQQQSKVQQQQEYISTNPQRKIFESQHIQSQVVKPKPQLVLPGFQDQHMSSEKDIQSTKIGRYASTLGTDGSLPKEAIRLTQNINTEEKSILSGSQMSDQRSRYGYLVETNKQSLSQSLSREPRKKIFSPISERVASSLMLTEQHSPVALNSQIISSQIIMNNNSQQRIMYSPNRTLQTQQSPQALNYLNQQTAQFQQGKPQLFDQTNNGINSQGRLQQQQLKLSLDDNNDKLASIQQQSQSNQENYHNNLELAQLKVSNGLQKNSKIYSKQDQQNVHSNGNINTESSQGKNILAPVMESTNRMYSSSYLSQAEGQEETELHAPFYDGIEEQEENIQHLLEKEKDLQTKQSQIKIRDKDNEFTPDITSSYASFKHTNGSNTNEESIDERFSDLNPMAFKDSSLQFLEEERSLKKLKNSKKEDNLSMLLKGLGMLFILIYMTKLIFYINSSIFGN